ncbi:hypothetical protein OH76DRAFT_361418 [Lentinus brumalis]|uniref:Uncharacterized protein n=1 Tax=Lentinus brumalis TaxID=2498619 RepID=A0A371CJ43_9APHY|nr:hypothetical protein OH76DRAFT_361418 [Polyporus brumalis]
MHGFSSYTHPRTRSQSRPAMLPLVVTRPAPKIPAGLSVTSHGVKGYLKGLWTYVILGAISTTMLGIFSILVFCATIVLARKGLRNRSTLILLGTMYAMYASTMGYWVILVLNAIGYYQAAQAYGLQFHCQCLAASFWNVVDTYPMESTCTHLQFGLSGTMQALTTCVSTIILTVNVGSFLCWSIRLLVVR